MKLLWELQGEILDNLRKAEESTVRNKNQQKWFIFF